MEPVVDHIRTTVESRLRELEPVITEIEQLQCVLTALSDPAAIRQLTSNNTLAALLGDSAGPLPGAGAPGDGESTAAVATVEPAAAAEPGALQPLIRYRRKGTKPGRNGRAPQGYNKRRIIEEILEHPGATAPEIAAATGIKRTIVSATIHRLKRIGELEAHGDGVRVPLVPVAA